MKLQARKRISACEDTVRVWAITVLVSTTDLTIIKAVAGSQIAQGDVQSWAVQVA